MHRAAKQIAVCAAALIVFCVVCRFVFFHSYTVYVPLNTPPEQSAQQDDVRMRIDQPEVLRADGVEFLDGYARVKVRPEHAGETMISFGRENGDAESIRYLRVDRLMTVFDASTGGFTGDTVVLIAVTLFWLLVCGIMLWNCAQAKGAAFYSYATLYYAGFSVFALVTGLTMLRITVSHILHPARYTMMQAYSAINSASAGFMMLTTPLILIFAAAMAVSNIALLRHTRTKLQNVMGLLVSALLILGEAVGWYLFTRDFMGSEWEVRIRNTLQNSYATVFVYCECMLTGAIYCGIRAARHQPAHDKDFIIILGCWFRKDGTLPPLLKGRVDRAVAFWQKQKQETGREALFIPSGGQGPDEPMPEAEAMRRYLTSHGVPERLILTEDRSANTYQNMVFSKELMQAVNPEGRAVFSTTNYHVFRSGLWASQAGLKVEGIGSRTKWWFWPNAFMREMVSLLVNRWRQELFFLILLNLFFGVLSMVL